MQHHFARFLWVLHNRSLHNLPQSAGQRRLLHVCAGDDFRRVCDHGDGHRIRSRRWDIRLDLCTERGGASIPDEDEATAGIRTRKRAQ